MDIREINRTDLHQLFELYTQLHDNDIPAIDVKIEELWETILSDKHHHIIVGIVDNKIVSSCVMVIVPNLTHKQRPYALVENVITHEQYRNKGYAASLLHFAKNIAIKENCYKIMLMTGSKKESTLNFYRKAGYNQNDKTAFIQWLD